MKVLVVGGGGREHALAWKLSQEAEVVCAPGNAGIADDVENIAIPTADHSALIDLWQSRKFDLVVVGPEDPLIDGLSDRLRSAGAVVYGPEAASAHLEGSKAFSKSVMASAGVPTASFETFSDPERASAYVRSRFAEGKQVAVKASGNALGKGVIVAETLDQALAAVQSMMVDRVFGEAGATVVIEDRLKGREFSLLTIVGDHNIHSLPVSQDHKRAFDGDMGPNTGGMGTYSPCDWVTTALIEEVEERMVKPTISELRSRGLSYRGTLFTGVMLDDSRPYCLEFNVRFGDPETQTVMRRLGSGFAQSLLAAASGDVVPAIPVLQQAALTVVMASGGYPEAYPKGLLIQIGELKPAVKVFHAGTKLTDGQLVTNGGRVLGVSAVGQTLSDAKRLAYEATKAIQFDGAFYRSDIG